MSIRLPTSTYRFQFDYRFTLEDASALIEYLSDLGISDCYASPLALARPDSIHGYDVTDHSMVNPEIGGEETVSPSPRGRPSQRASRGCCAIAIAANQARTMLAGIYRWFTARCALPDLKEAKALLEELGPNR